MALHVPKLATGLLCGLLLCAGCNQTAARDPFARQDPNVELQGLAVVAAGALGQLGITLNDTAAALRGDSPRYLEWAQTLNNPDSRPDELREAMLGLVRYEHGREPPYTDAYAHFADNSPHGLVRASAIRALNISRNESATPLFIRRLSDEEARVRLEAAKALANIPDEAAVDALIARATNVQENLDVRVAAISALSRYDAPASLQALIRLLEEDDFSLAWQARRSLVTATGQDHGYSIDDWRRAVG